MERHVHPAATQGYGRAADVYARARPSYPGAAVDWLLTELGAQARVVEVGAGTGSSPRSTSPRRTCFGARTRVGRMDFFVYSRDAPGAGPLRDDRDLLERHWSYMDGFADTMVARGPTLAGDRDTATGSLHVVGLPSVDAVRAFVEREPNNCAGVYDRHSIWRFENLLGRTMWEFPRVSDEPTFLVIARTSGEPAPLDTLSGALRGRLILYGGLSTPDNDRVGIGLALQAADGEMVEALLAGSGLGLDPGAEIEIHNWEFGGRR